MGGEAGARNILFMKESVELSRIQGRTMNYGSIATRHSLLTRLKNWEDQDGWKRFFDTYWRLIYATAINSGCSEAEAQEVVQETVLSVAKKMREFKYDPSIGCFKGWLFRLTRWRVADQMRKRRGNHVPLESVTPSVDAATTVDSAETLQTSEWEQRWKENLMDAAMERVKEHISPKQWQIFDLYALRHWRVSDVAQTLGVPAAQVYLVKCRVVALVKKEIKRLQSEIV